MSVTILPMMLEMSRLFGGFFLAPSKSPSYFHFLDTLSYVKHAPSSLSPSHFLRAACVLRAAAAAPASRDPHWLAQASRRDRCIGWSVVRLAGSSSPPIYHIMPLQPNHPRHSESSGKTTAPCHRP